jgi:diguanylate cyclase (GGDEF)-like protein
MTFLKKHLHTMFHLIEKETVEEAIESLKNISVDMIIIDEKSCETPIFTSCPKIRLLKGYETTPILLITSNLKQTFIFKALNAGVSDFLHEPLDEEELFERIAVAMKVQERQKKMGSLIEKVAKSSLLPKEDKKLSQRLLLNEEVLKEVTRAKKNSMPLSLVMIEIDDASRIAKEWGDLAFEELLTHLSSFLKQRLRKNDSLFPQGGGKYLILFPKTSSSAAKAIADLIRKEIKEEVFVTNKAPLRITASIGLISYAEPAIEQENIYTYFDTLLLKVNQALSKAKKKGNATIKG